MSHPANITCQTNNRNTRKRNQIYSKLTIKIDVVLVFLLLTLNIFHTFFGVPIVDFEQVTVSWVMML